MKLNFFLPALAIRQPWATSIVHFGRRHENRNWSDHDVKSFLAGIAPFRNRILIYANSGMTRAELAEFHRFVEDRGIDIPEEAQKKSGFELPRGGIIGIATVVGWVTESDSPWFTGPGAFELTDVEHVPFRPYKGPGDVFFPGTDRRRGYLERVTKDTGPIPKGVHQVEIVEALKLGGQRKEIPGVHLIEQCVRCGKRVSIMNDNTPNPLCPQDMCELNAATQPKGPQP